MGANLTTGQTFAREMRKNHGIGTRTRRFTRRALEGDMFREVLLSIAHANNEPGYYSERREAIFRTAYAALSSYEKHITGYRANPEVITHIAALTPWQFCNLIAEMIDAKVTNTGEGEAFFRAMGQRITA